MKPIKILLLFCAMLIGAVGVQAQVTALTAPGSPGTVSIPVTGTICPGTEITATFVAGNVTQGGCAAVQPYLQLVSGGGTVLAEVTSATVTLGTPGAGILTLTVPAAAAATSNNFLRYLTKDTGCNFTGTGTSAPGITVSPIVTAPTGTSISPASVCRTSASNPFNIVPSGTCAAGNLRIYDNNSTLGGGVATWASNSITTAGDYTYYLGCVSGTCETLPASRVAVTHTVHPIVTGPSGVAAVTSPGCVGVIPTVTGLTCPAGTTVALVSAARVELGAPDFATAGTIDIWAACKSTATGCLSESIGLVMLSYSKITPPTAGTLNPSIATASPAGVSGGGGTTVTLCAETITGSTTLAFNATCTSGTFKVWTAETGGTQVTGTPVAPTTSTDYWIDCTVGTCTGPRTKVSFIVTPSPTAPTGTSISPASVCQTTASVPFNIVPAGTCATGNLRIFSNNTTLGGGVATWASNSITVAGDYTYYLGCVSGTCETAPANRVAVTHTVHPLVAGPTGTASVTSPGCVGVIPTVTGLSCAVGSVVLTDPAGVELTAANFAAVATFPIWAACKSTTGCKSESLGLVIASYSVINPPTAAPLNPSIQTSAPAGVVSAGGTVVTICAEAITGTTMVDFNATCAGGSIKVWTAETGGSMVTAPSTAPTASTDYWIACTIGTCTGPRTKVSYVVTPSPTAPTGTSIAPTAICQTTASITFNIVPTGTCATGSLRIYSNNTSLGGGVAVWPSNSITPAGTYTYYLGCVSGTCETAPASRVAVTHVVNPIPAGPSGSSTTAEAGCLGVTPAITGLTCAAGTNLVLTDGAGVNFNYANFSVLGTYDLWAICENPTTGCRSESLGLVRTGYQVINPPAAGILNPSIQTSSPAGVVSNAGATVTICAEAITSSTTLNFNATCASGPIAGTFKVWNAETGGTQVNGPIPAPSASTDYWIDCTIGTCTGTRTKLSYVVSPSPTAPTGTSISPAAVCNTVASNPFNIVPTGTCATGTLNIYANNTTLGGGAAVWPSNSVTLPGTYTYYLGCVSNGCETAPANRVAVTHVVNPIPAGPSGSSTTASVGCVGVIPAITGLTCASGSNIVMTDAAGVNFNTALFSTAGTYDLWAICENPTTGCRSTSLGLVRTGYQVINPPAAGALNPSIQTSSPAGVVSNGGTTVTICAETLTSSTLLNFNATCVSGSLTGTFKVWTAETGGTQVTGSPAAPSTSTDYWIDCTIGTCTGARTKVSYVVTPSPTAPTGTSISPAEVCNTVASVPFNIVPSGTCATGSLRIYSNNTTLGGGVASWPSNSITAPGTYTYYLGCVSGTCETAPASRVAVTHTVNPLPPTATISASPAGSPVCAGTITLSAAGCAATDSIKIWEGSTLVKAGVGSTLTADVFKAPSSITTYTFSARCYTLKGCTPATANSVTFDVYATIKTPVASISPASRCEADGTAPMFFNTDCGALATVWYTQATGGTAIASLPNTTPSTPGTTTYYAACVDLGGTGCESPIRARVDFVVYPKGSTPTNVSLTADGVTVNANQNKSVCDIAGNAISFTGCASGETILYSVDGGNYTATVPTQMVDGLAHNYRIRCQAGSGASACAGAESGIMTLTIFVQPTVAPIANVTPAVVCSAAPAQPFGGSSNCGVLATVWFDATTNAQLLSLPSSTSAFAPGTYSYYAKCLGAGGCLSPASAVTTLTVINNTTAPTITSIGGDEVCTGVNVTLTTNCPSGSSVVWSTGATGNALPLVANQPQVRAITAKCVTTVGSTSCESPMSATKVIIWKAFDLTVINIGSSQSGVKPGAGVPKSAWAANFVTVDAGPSLQSSSQSNPSVFFTENPNKMGPRFWTIHVEACALPTTGSISYDMLATPETGVPVSFNTVENNAPYLMYANRDGFTELYAQNNPFFGFWADNGSGGNKYDAGLPKGLYKLSIRYWDQKGLGAAPATRIPQGNQLAYQEYWFRIQSQLGIGTGAAREGVGETTETEFAIATPNPVTRTLTVSINGAKGQEVKLNLVDAAGRTIKTSTVTPETNTHREEVDMTSQNTGMYFMQVSSPTKRASLKVLKVSQD